MTSCHTDGGESGSKGFNARRWGLGHLQARRAMVATLRCVLLGLLELGSREGNADGFILGNNGLVWRHHGAHAEPESGGKLGARSGERDTQQTEKYT